MLAVQRRQDIARVMAQILADHRSPGTEGTTLRRARIGDGDNLSNHPLVPACSGLDEQIIFVGTIAEILQYGTFRLPAQIRTASLSILVRLSSPRVYVPNAASAACCRRSPRNLLGRATVIA